MRNCPNCAAPLQAEEIKCPYCGTSYIDMSCIDLENHEPFYLKINMHGCQMITMVRPEVANMTISAGAQYAYGGRGMQKFISYQTDPEVNIDISFSGIPNSKNHIITYIKENK